MSTLFQGYLGHNLLDIVARSTVFEDYVLTKEDVQQVVNTHFEPLPFGYKTRKEVLNLYEAWIFVHLFSLVDVNITTFEDLHELISSGVTDKPQLEGQFRSEDFPVSISGTLYQPPSVSRTEAQAEFNDLLSFLKEILSSKDTSRYVKIEQILLFNHYDLNCFLWFPTLEELEVFLDKLKVCYESVDLNTDLEFVDYLRSTWFIDFSL